MTSPSPEVLSRPRTEWNDRPVPLLPQNEDPPTSRSRRSTTRSRSSECRTNIDAKEDGSAPAAVVSRRAVSGRCGVVFSGATCYGPGPVSGDLTFSDVSDSLGDDG